MVVLGRSLAESLRLVTTQPHNSDCFKGFLVQSDKVTGRVYPMPSRRQKWDCPPCATHKLAKATKHLVTRCERLCWGLYSEPKRHQARIRNIGYMTISYRDDVRMMIAESHLYEPPKPSLEVVKEVVAYSSDRTVSRLGWADKWRPDNTGDGDRYEIIDTDTDNLAKVNAAIERAGCMDGKLNGQDPIAVKSLIEQILNGVRFGD